MFSGKKGMTLTEMIVAVAIMGIITIPIGSMFYAGMTNYDVERYSMEAQSTARDAMECILEDLRKNEFSLSSYVDGKLAAFPFDRFHDNNTNTDTFIYYIVKDTTQHIVKDSTEFAYSFSGNTLTRQGSGMSNSPWNNVTQFSVSDDTASGFNDVITITISARVKNGRPCSLTNNYRRKAPVTNN